MQNYENDKSLSQQEIRQKFAQQSRIVVVARVVMVVTFFVMFLGNSKNENEIVRIVLAAIVLVAFFIAYQNRRCPSCRQFIGVQGTPRFCPNCSVQLSD